MSLFSAKVEHTLADYEEIVTIEAEDESDVRARLTSAGFFVYEVWLDEEDE